LHERTAKSAAPKLWRDIHPHQFRPVPQLLLRRTDKAQHASKLLIHKNTEDTTRTVCLGSHPGNELRISLLRLLRIAGTKRRRTLLQPPQPEASTSDSILGIEQPQQ